MSLHCRGKRVRLVAYTDSSGFGGAEEVLGTLLEHLPGDFEITIMGVADETVDRLAERRPNAETVVVPVVSSKRDVKAILGQIRTMRALAPDICYVNLQTPYAGQYGQLAGLLTNGCKVVVTEHSTLASSSRFRRWLKRRLSARLAAHVGVGDKASRMIEADAGLRHGAISVIHNGVPRPNDDERPNHLAPGVVVGSIGRIDHLKGYDVAVEAMAAVPGATLVLVGEGKERQALDALAARHGVEDRVVLAGWRDDGMQCVAGFDVFVLPSRLEGFPLSILEAMHRGKPVVATDVGSVSEMVADGETGFLVPPGDGAALANALNRFVGDAALREELGAAGRRRARAQFELPTMTAAYEQLFRRLCEQDGASELRGRVNEAARRARGGIE